MRQEADAQAARADHLAALGSQFAGDGAQKRGFAGAVGTDEADARTVADGPGEIAENLAPEEVDGEVMEGGDVHGGMIAVGRGIILTVSTSTGVNMTRALWVLLLLFTVSMAAAQDDASQTPVEFTDHPARVVTNINALRVRSTPSIEADNIVGRLQPGQQVHVLGREGDWQQVRSEDGLFGWSHSDYLVDLSTRQIGETRLFRIDDELVDTSVLVNADLRHIGKHSYIYFAEHPRQSNTVNLGELRTFAKAFDEYIFPEIYALWDPDPKPSHGGDERIVILFVVGYKKANTSVAGFYHTRGDMPGELHPHSNRTGFLEMTWHNMDPRTLPNLTAHELQHLIQHHFDDDESSWVNEGLAVLISVYLDSSALKRIYTRPDLHQPYCQLNSLWCGYGPGFLFTTYILEQLGLEALRDFVRRPENGLAAMDALLADLDSGLDTETFFADFVLADYLRDTQLVDDRFGYRLLRSPSIHRPYVRGRIISLPTLIQGSSPPYATDFYKFALPASDQPQHLELTLQFPSSAAQDGWLQQVQVVDGEVILQRFRAREYRGRKINVTIQPNADQAFLAISPFRADARSLTSMQPYSLEIHIAGSDVDGVDYVTNSVEAAAVTKPSEQRSPTQLAMEIDATIEEWISDTGELIRYQDRSLVERKIEESIARVEELLAAGADISGTIGGTLLAKVVKYIQSPELVSMLLEAGANPNEVGSYRFTPRGMLGTYQSTPLNYAVFFGDVATAKRLLDAGAYVQNPDATPSQHIWKDPYHRIAARHRD